MYRTLFVLALAAFGAAGTALAQQSHWVPVGNPTGQVKPSNDPRMHENDNSLRPALRGDIRGGVESSHGAANAAVLHGCVAQPQNSDMLAHCSSANDFRTLDLCMKAYLYQISQCVQANSVRGVGRPVAILPGVTTPIPAASPQDMMLTAPAPAGAAVAR